MRYDTIVFDLDGTLLDTLEDLKEAVNVALAGKGYPPRTYEEIRRFVGNGNLLLMERALPEQVKADLDEEGRIKLCEELFNDFKVYYKAHCLDHTGPYPGVMPLLHELKARGIKIGVASNKVREAVEDLSRICFEGLIDAAAGPNETIPTKPNPAMVDEVLARLGASKENTLYVGDSQVDVATAKNAGLDMVTVLWGFRDEEELQAAGATTFIHKAEELLAYL